MQSTISTYCNTPFGVAAYRNAVSQLALDREEEAAVIEAARAGDQRARDRLIEDCVRAALVRAVGLAIWYRALRGVTLDPQDIAQEAGLRAILRIEKALASPNPVGYLRRAIEGAMLTYCRERQSAVRVPVCMQSRKRIPPVEVLSLDAPIGEDGSATLADLIAS
jgi:DNA-directed RNA polymerase specialized sigma subunit